MFPVLLKSEIASGHRAPNKGKDLPVENWHFFNTDFIFVFSTVYWDILKQHHWYLYLDVLRPTILLGLNSDLPLLYPRYLCLDICFVYLFSKQCFFRGSLGIEDLSFVHFMELRNDSVNPANDSKSHLMVLTTAVFMGFPFIKKGYQIGSKV